MSACLERPLQARLRLHLHRSLAHWRTLAAELFTRASAALLLLAASPVLLILIACGCRLHRVQRFGRGGQTYTDYSLITPSGRPMPVAATWPRLWNLVAGNANWIGPAARNLPNEANLTSEAGRRIATIKPGVVCTWWIRHRTNVAYTPQTETDLEYVEARSPRHDLGIAIRALLTLAYGKPKATACPPVAEILNLPLDNLTLTEAVEAILQPRPAAAARQVSFLNVDCVNKSKHDAEYRDILRTSDLRLADGIGLRVAGSLLGQEIRQNVNGTDLFPVLCERMARTNLSVFLLGARPGVPEEVAAWIAANHPGAMVAGVQHGFYTADQEDSVVDAINQSGADVLLVAFGAPRQEKWIRRNRNRLQVRTALGVGGLFDFYSGRTPRAPLWLRELGLEWTWRLWQEPRRMWQRYLIGNVVFLARVFFSKFFGAPREQQEVRWI